jgi:hypothetical protein
MHLRGSASIALIALTFATSAAAPAFAQDASSARPVDAKLLPISLHRIQREIRQAAETGDHDGLRLRYQVDVYGRAPAIEFFTKEDNLRDGPVPYGGPTHKEMLEMMTPREYRAPVADFSAFMRWLADKADKQDKK